MTAARRRAVATMSTRAAEADRSLRLARSKAPLVEQPSAARTHRIASRSPRAPRRSARTSWVELTCEVSLPFLGLVADPFTGGATIHKTAHAQAAVTPPQP